MGTRVVFYLLCFVSLGPTRFVAALCVFETESNVTNDISELVRQCVCRAIHIRGASRLRSDL